MNSSSESEFFEKFLFDCMEDSSSFIFTSSESSSRTGSDDSEFEDLPMMFVGQDDRNAISRYLEEIVPSYTEKEFITHFRVTRDLYNSIVEKFGESIEYTILEAGKAFSPQIHIALFLWFAGHEGCSYRDIGDRFNLSLGTVCRIINRSLRFLSNLSDVVIKWPTNEQKTETDIWMRNKTGIQGVIGKIHITYVDIL